MKEPKCKRTPSNLWPPKDAFFESVCAYRLVKSETVLSDEDFLATIDDDIKDDNLRPQFEANDEYYAVSIFEEIEDIKALISKIPFFKTKFKAIANGITQEEDGYIRRSSGKNRFSSHLNWWLFENAKPASYFVIVEVL